MKLPEEIQTWDVDDLAPYEANARVHPKEQIAKLVQSIKEYGWTIPILARSDGEIIAGHGRVLAAREAGIREVPVIIADHLNDDQRRAYRLADNRLTEMADWSDTLLAEEIKAIIADDIDPETLGFARAEIDAIIAENTPEKPKPIPEAPENPVIEKDDLWHLGDHRLICGAPTAENIQRLMAGEKAALFATTFKESVGFGYLLATTLAEALNENPALYLWHTDRDRVAAEEVWENQGIFKHQTIIWDKKTAQNNGNDYQVQHEPCLYGWVKGNRPFIASHKVDNSTIWEVDAGGEAHPPELYAIPMRKHVKRGGICFEPHADLGAQIIAGEENGRRVFALEEDPAKVEVIIRRWEQVNGEMAEREDGKELGQIK